MSETLNSIHNVLQTLFEEREQALRTGAEQPHYEPEESLTEAKVAELIKETHDRMITVLPNKDKTETEREAEIGHFLLAMSRDHMLADRSRLLRCRDAGEYVRRSLLVREHDDDDTVDGMLAGNVRKVGI